MLVIHVGIRGPGQRHDPTAERLRDPIRGGPPAIAMDERGSPARAIRPPQPADLANGPPQEFGGLGHEELPAIEGMEDLQALLGTMRQGNHASLSSAQRGEDIFAEQLGRT